MKKLLASMLIFVSALLQAKVVESSIDSSVLILKHDTLSLVEVEWYERVRVVECTMAGEQVVRMLMPSTFFVGDSVSTIFFCSKEGLMVQRTY